jgi:hypothetical protein
MREDLMISNTLLEKLNQQNEDNTFRLRGRRINTVFLTYSDSLIEAMQTFNYYHHFFTLSQNLLGLLHYQNIYEQMKDNPTYQEKIDRTTKELERIKLEIIEKQIGDL